jgi:hypothetical protein
MPGGRRVLNSLNDGSAEVYLNDELLASLEPSRHFVLVECGATL